MKTWYLSKKELECNPKANISDGRFWNWQMKCTYTYVGWFKSSVYVAQTITYQFVVNKVYVATYIHT